MNCPFQYFYDTYLLIFKAPADVYHFFMKIAIINVPGKRIINILNTLYLKIRIFIIKVITIIMKNHV
jgi:hypothetical protein